MATSPFAHPPGLPRVMQVVMVEGYALRVYPHTGPDNQATRKARTIVLESGARLVLPGLVDDTAFVSWLLKKVYARVMEKEMELMSPLLNALWDGTTETRAGASVKWSNLR